MKEKINERVLPKKSMNKIHQAEDDFAKNVFGDKYGQKNNALTKYFPKGDIEIQNNADVKSGLFSIGNAKLSPDTLIINFTSALGCPSMNDCPITQKACYAVAGENRLTTTRRKNLIVQNLVRHAQSNKIIDGLFDIAELYISESMKTKMPIKFIRYNEAGDFTNQELLVKSALFSLKVREQYGVLSMAYTANKRIDPSQMVNGQPIDTIIAINRSRNDIPTSKDSLRRNFFGVPMNNFSINPNINLENAYADVEYVSDSTAQQLKVETPVNGKYGIPSVPKLNYGSWDGGSGWYYVCPCSFWRYNKDKATKEFLVQQGAWDENEEFPTNPAQITKIIKSSLSPEQQKQLKKILNKIISPCGTKCAVCHDVEGGLTPDGQIVKDYAVLAATHGAGATNYDADYASKKREGDDTAVYKDASNPHGLERKYFQKYNTDSPIRNELINQRTRDDESIKKEKDLFTESYKRLFGNIL